MEVIRPECLWLADVRAYGEIRDRCRADEHAASPHAARLRLCAEQFCRDAAPAVTDKQFTRYSPSHDPHDYVSIGTYWWPNPESPDGLPYVSRAAPEPKRLPCPWPVMSAWRTPWRDSR